MAKAIITIEDVGVNTVALTTEFYGAEGPEQAVPTSLLLGATIKALYATGKLGEYTGQMLQGVIDGKGLEGFVVLEGTE